MRRLAWCTLAFAGCVHRARPPRNVVDQLSRSDGRSESGAAPGSLVHAYRAIVRPVLGAECRWLPGDSEELVRSMRSCGAVRATYGAFAELLEEPDLYAEQPPVLISGGRLRWLRGDLWCDP